MKLKDIFKKIEDSNAAKEKARGEIAVLERELDDLNARAESVAATGNEDEYIRLTDEASRITRRIYVKKKISEVPAEKEIKESEVVDAWNEYAAEYEKTYDKNFEKFVKARQQLRDVYETMMQDQNDALMTREKLYNMVRPPANTATTIDIRFPFKRLPILPTKIVGTFESVSPIIRCYGMNFRELITPMLFAADLIDKETAERWISIINGVTAVLPEKKYRPEIDQHVDKFGLFINKK